ncbi:chromate efflux transporter [Permianibacter aggregans]|uniref:Chromate transporter n=1 Tax=Permianibacter aggregans TaxID=1510150 RepID=A0A4R6UL47_9GAMM|nr:chromate efflux transporter [Permianibacter aggregans]QGX39274.1 chromate efflux transporter [Permianibacter aggregans]TDQ46083.1 chromate transporter [Permianibacter aggregans]
MRFFVKPLLFYNKGVLRPVSNRPSAIPFREAAAFWLKLGLISFGGPAGQIAIMHQELVERRRWVREPDFLHALNYCMMLPGPEAQQLATYLGWLMHGRWGGIVAGGLFVLPALVILVALSWIYVRFGQQPIIAALFYGIKPAVVAIIFHACWRIGKRTLHHPMLMALAAAAFVGIFFLQLPFPLIIFAAGVMGWLGAHYRPAIFSPVHQQENDPPPTATTGSLRASPLRSLAYGVVLWAVPMLALLWWFGGEHVFSQMAWFFTKAALLTFGGAYAVLPYVQQAAVDHYAWLSANQMIDGLALGETTPGPLIMVVVFVAYLGGYGSQVWGEAGSALAGTTAALITTWFTFLPSFLFVLLGAPIIEKTRGIGKVTGPLTAITAAVVGVMVNLGVYFAQWSIFANQTLDIYTLLVSLVALLLLVKQWLGVIPLIAVSALAGVIYRLVF